MSASNLFSENALRHYFQNTAHVNVGDPAGVLPSAVPGNLYLALHFGDPTGTGDQESSEADYVGYARLALARTSTVWQVTPGDPAFADNLMSIIFAAPTGLTGNDIITHASLGSALTGPGVMHFSTTLVGALPLAVGISPAILPGGSIWNMT